MVEKDRQQITTRRTRFACWITKGKNTEAHSQYSILNRFPTIKTVPQ